MTDTSTASRTRVRLGSDLLIESGRPGLAGPYIRALKNTENEIVNRAAEALQVSYKLLVQKVRDYGLTSPSTPGA